MATGTNGKILEALYAHLKTLVFTPALEIALPDIDFPKGGGDKPDNYLEILFLPNQTRQVTYGDDAQQYRGIFQVTVLWKSGQGAIKALDTAGEIIKHFKDEVLFSDAEDVRIVIDREPWASPKIPDGARTRWPVSIPYHAFENEA